MAVHATLSSREDPLKHSSPPYTPATFTAAPWPQCQNEIWTKFTATLLYVLGLPFWSPILAFPRNSSLSRALMSSEGGSPCLAARCLPMRRRFSPIFQHSLVRCCAQRKCGGTLAATKCDCENAAAWEGQREWYYQEIGEMQLRKRCSTNAKAWEVQDKCCCLRAVRARGLRAHLMRSRECPSRSTKLSSWHFSWPGLFFTHLCS